MEMENRSYKENGHSKLKGNSKSIPKGKLHFGIKKTITIRNVGKFALGNRPGGYGGTDGADRQSGAFRC